MRVWDVDPKILCQSHLLGEHREIHAIWNILTLDRSGYRNHPETQRWVGKLTALKLRHDRVAAEIERRNFKHLSPLPEPPRDRSVQDTYINTIDEQITILRAKPCACPLL